VLPIELLTETVAEGEVFTASKICVPAGIVVELYNVGFDMPLEGKIDELSMLTAA